MHDRLIQFVALLVLILGLGGSFALTPTINQQRVDRQLTYAVDLGEDASPQYTLVAALGSFRGVAINILWQRSEALKQEEKFFEANNLAEMITTLQPRFPEAWNFQAWNMAYNISVKCKTAEERWDWVNKGIKLLRDRGIPNNPNSVVLYRSLAWILGHKVAGQTDDKHWYYKARFCESWQTLLGAPDPRWQLRPEFLDPAKRPADDELDPLKHGQWVATVQFAGIADIADRFFKREDRDNKDFNPANYFNTLSPERLQEFYAQYPDCATAVSQFEMLSDADGKPLGLGLNAKTLRAFGRLIMFEEAGYPIDSPVVSNPQTLGVDAMAINAWLSAQPKNLQFNFDPNTNVDATNAQLKQTNPDARLIDLVPLLNLLRAQTLIADYHMDPAFMLECMNRFGPIDWRHPSAHSVYWTALGTLRAEQWAQNKERIDFINANRATIHALQNLAHNGKISFRPEVPGLGEMGKESINHTPDIRMIPAYATAWEETMQKIDAGEFGEKHKGQTDTYANGHENFLQAATYLYYFSGRQDLARKYFDQAKKLYASSKSSPAAGDGQYNLSLSDFARVRLEDDLGFQQMQMINYWIRLAWTNGLASRDRNVMARYLGAAKQTYDKFLEDRQTSSKGEEGVQGRQAIPPFEDLVLGQFLMMMNSSEFSLPQKSGIWQIGAPLLASLSRDRPIIYEAYAMMFNFIQSQAKAEGWGDQIYSAFPEPNGFREWFQQQQNAQPEGTPPPLLPAQ